MPANTRVIKRRIKSVKNTKKITKAMELVAASKMRRAVSSVQSTRPFTHSAWATVRSLEAVSGELSHPLLTQPDKVKNVLFILFTSDRGLCGGFNNKMIKEARNYLNDLAEEINVTVVTVGKRGADAMRRMKKNISASFTELSNNPSFVDIRPITKMVLDGFTSGEYQKVILGYTDFDSAVSQTPNIFDLLPLKPEKPTDLGETANDETVDAMEVNEYIFEPSPAIVLDSILPKVVESMIWQALLESAASEHSARMMAMRSASDSASEMIDDLTLTFNQARQASITQEIAEISSGKAALEE